MTFAGTASTDASTTDRVDAMKSSSLPTSGTKIGPMMSPCRRVGLQTGEYTAPTRRRGGQREALYEIQAQEPIQRFYLLTADLSLGVDEVTGRPQDRPNLRPTTEADGEDSTVDRRPQTRDSSRGRDRRTACPIRLASFDQVVVAAEESTMSAVDAPVVCTQKPRRDSRNPFLLACSRRSWRRTRRERIHRSPRGPCEVRACRHSDFAQ